MHDEVVTDDKVVDDGEEALAAAIAEFRVHHRSRGWARAWRVVERVELEPEDLPTAEEEAAARAATTKEAGAGQATTKEVVFRRISLKDFADRVGSRKTVISAYRAGWRRGVAAGYVPKAGLLVPGYCFELPDEEQVPFFGEDGVYHSYEAVEMATDRVAAIKREAESAGLKPTATVYVAKNQSALRTAVLADPESRKTVIAAVKEFNKRQTSADTVDRAAAGRVGKQRAEEHDAATAAELATVRTAVLTARADSAAEASMEVFNAMADVRLGTLRALSLLQQQKVVFTPERAEAIAELCDGAEAAIGFIRHIATGVGTALDDAALQAFLDESQDLL